MKICPSCNQPLHVIKAEPIDLMPTNLYAPPEHVILFCCPHPGCEAILGITTDLTTMKDEIVQTILQALRG